MRGRNVPLRIPYTGEDFPINLLNREGDLRTGWDELTAALTVGRPSTAFVFRHGDSSLHEARFRIALVHMALEQAWCTGELRRTDAFMALDPTEKGAVSYFLGMTVCKLFASRLLNIPWLLHLDVFRDQLRWVTLGRSRPDLVGQDHRGRWHAFRVQGEIERAERRRAEEGEDPSATGGVGGLEELPAASWGNLVLPTGRVGVPLARPGAR